MIKDRRQDIVRAAIELFSLNGFRGTTTRDLATQAGVNEAIIFRHFKTKRDLYSAILDLKACEGREALQPVMEKMAAQRDDEGMFREVARTILDHHLKDAAFLRLLMFSALEGHELADMFMTNLAKDSHLVRYIETRMAEGAFRKLDAHLAVMAFMNMLFGFIQRQQWFPQPDTRSISVDEAADTFVSIFLRGVQS